MNSGCRFYCFECRKSFDDLWNELQCPYCTRRIFESYKDLENYLREEELVAGKEPFDKPRGFKKNRSYDG